MKLKHLIIVSALGVFALISGGASAETYHFGEGQSSMSANGTTKHHSSAPKHRKHGKRRNTAS